MSEQGLAPVTPGSIIGILGGGQLGRMLAMAAAQLGYRCHILAPEDNSPAAEVAADFTCAQYYDSAALEALAARCAVITYEFENVPVGPLGLIADKVPLFPPPRALEIAQSRIDEKNFARDLGGTTARFAVANDRNDLDQALEVTGLPAIIKSNRFGYDGKGQARVRADDNLAERWHEAGRKPSIVEAMVDFFAEFSLILVRGRDGEIRFWDAPHNVHEHGILARSTVPAGADITAQAEAAKALAAKVADALGYVGVMTLEFFATADGPVFNEMAPRVHNSGHWTIEGSLTSQFENHIRAICGLPLGDTALSCKAAEMRNLIGDDVHQWRDLLGDPANHLHLYGKDEARPGRKMGHVTRLTV